MVRPAGRIDMASDEDIEFSVAEDRRYTKEHLWLQVIDKEEDEDGNVKTSVKVGVSEYVSAAWGEFIRVTLPNLQELEGFEDPSEKSTEKKSSFENDFPCLWQKKWRPVLYLHSRFLCGSRTR